MTTAETFVYYPQYCFHLSPTINKWCPLRAADIPGLESKPGFEDIGVLFCLNHPIKWVRITGVVVAIDDYYGHRVYTVDDSTGKCIECTLTVPTVTSDKTRHVNNSGNNDTSTGAHIAPAKIATLAHTADTNATNGPLKIPPPADIDVGTVLDVKGTVKLFRGQRQITIWKLTRVLSTNQEVLFWDKIRDLRRDVLSKPWVLKDREVRRCRKLQQAEADESGSKKRKKTAGGLARDSSEGRRSSAEGKSAPGVGSRSKNSLGTTLAKAAKVQHTTRAGSSRSAGDGGKYDALGL
ncbi:hypothetical protein F5Y14DRAFT_258324 [Nemania sp. NC0429]|nr:hypothetical protein F5Y14DRAFT_258324 [Nemania sp. NC0429]